MKNNGKHLFAKLGKYLALLAIYGISAKAFALSVSVSASPTTILPGGSTTITWSSSGATSCNFEGYNWPLNGSQTASPAATKTYTLTCYNGPGQASDSVTVYVESPPAPSVSTSISPGSIYVGQTATLYWSSSNASSCDWGSTSGSSSVGPYYSAGTYSFTVFCSGSGGSSSDTSYLSVSEYPPTIYSFTITPSTVEIGQTATWSWDSNADSCSYGGATYPPSGSITGGPYYQTTTNSARTIYCTGPGGTVSKTAYLTVSDSTPDSFSFSDQTGVYPNTSITSNAVTVSGFNVTLPVSVSGQGNPQVSINGGSWTTSGNINSGGTIQVRLTSAGSWLTTRSATISVGNTGTTWSVQTKQAPPTIDSFYVSPASVLVGESATWHWSSTNASSCSFGGNSYAASGSQVGGPYASAGPRTHTITCTGAGGSASATATLQVDEQDRVPDQFSFTHQNSAALDTLVTSNVITPTGYTGTIPVVVSGDGSPEVSVNNSAFAQSANISPGSTVQVRLMSASTFGTARSATVTIGDGASSVWTVTTLTQDTTPNAFSFTDQVGVPPNSVIDSNSVVVDGFAGSVPISISGDGSPAFSVNGGSFIQSGSVSSGDSVRLRLQSSPEYSTGRSATVTIGTLSDTWSVVTETYVPPPVQLQAGFDNLYSARYGDFDGVNGLDILIEKIPTGNYIAGVKSFVLTQNQDGTFAIDHSFSADDPRLAGFSALNAQLYVGDFDADGTNDLMLKYLGATVPFSGTLDQIIYASEVAGQPPVAAIPVDIIIDNFVDHVHSWVQNRSYFTSHFTEVCESLTGTNVAIGLISYVAAGETILIEVNGSLVYYQVPANGYYEHYAVVDFTDTSSENLALLLALGFAWQSGSTYCYDQADAFLENNKHAYIFTEDLASALAAGSFSSALQSSYGLEFFIEDAMNFVSFNIDFMNGALTDSNVFIDGQGSSLFDRDVQLTLKFFRWLDLIFDSRDKPKQTDVAAAVVHDDEPEVRCNKECLPDDFTYEEKIQIYNEIQVLAQGVYNGAYSSADEAAEALHNSELYQYSVDNGIEVWAVIDPVSYAVITVDTGYNHEYSDGIQVHEDKIWWHTHPGGASVWYKDINSAHSERVPVIYATGDELSKAPTSGVNDPPLRLGDGYKKYILRNGIWEEVPACVGVCDSPAQ